MNEREIDEIDNEEYRLNEMYTGPSETTEMYTVPVENNYCKSKNGWILFLIFTTLLFCGLFIYYFVSKKCKETSTEKEINFDKLTNTDEFKHWLLFGNSDRYGNRNLKKITNMTQGIIENSKKNLQGAKFSAAVTDYNRDPNVCPYLGDYE